MAMPEAQAAVPTTHGAARLPESIEHERQEHRGDADAAVGYRHFGIAFHLAQADLDVPALRRELERVRHEVPGNLLEAVTIADDHDVAVELAGHHDRLRRRGRDQRIDGIVDDRVHRRARVLATRSRQIGGRAR